MKDLKKIYTDDSYKIAYEELLVEHKRRQMLPTIFLKDMFNSFYKYRLFWACLLHFMYVFSGVFVVVFYTVILFNDISNNGSLMFVIVGLASAFGTIPGYYAGKYLGRKPGFLLGTFGQCITSIAIGIMITKKWFTLMALAMI